MVTVQTTISSICRITTATVNIFSHTLEDGSDYTQINQNSYVPTLILDEGTLITESTAILNWIAGQSTTLLPEGAMGRTRHLQMPAFISTEIHKPFIPLFFLEDQKDQSRTRKALAPRYLWIGS